MTGGIERLTKKPKTQQVHQYRTCRSPREKVGENAPKGKERVERGGSYSSSSRGSEEDSGRSCEGRGGKSTPHHCKYT